jgi:hypothetical protein
MKMKEEEAEEEEKEEEGAVKEIPTKIFGTLLFKATRG